MLTSRENSDFNRLLMLNADLATDSSRYGRSILRDWVLMSAVRSRRIASLHTVSALLWHANVTTTARYLSVKNDYLQELIDRKPLSLVC